MADYQLWMWGFNGNGELGTGNTTNYSSPVTAAKSVSYSSINFGQKFSLFLDTNGMVWASGVSDNGRLGNNQDSVDFSSPVSIARSAFYSQISAGFGHSLAIDGSTGQVYSWGWNSDGQLGTENTDNYSSPISIARAGSYVEIATGTNNSLAIDASTGMVWAWGSNESGNLGTNNETDYSSPVSIARAGSYTKVACGTGSSGSGCPWEYNCYFIDGSTGMIFSSGNNDYGQLGTNDKIDQSSPVSIARTGSYTTVAAGNQYVLAIDGSTGMVYSWGYNGDGQLGTNDITYQSSPVSIARSGSYIAISAARRHSIALDSDGMVWCWGQSVYGELGSNNNDNQSSPVSIARLSTYGAVSAGENFSGAIEGEIAPPTPPSPYVPEEEDNDSPRDYIGMHNEFANSPGGIKGNATAFNSFKRKIDRYI